MTHHNLHERETTRNMIADDDDALGRKVALEVTCPQCDRPARVPCSTADAVPHMARVRRGLVAALRSTQISLSERETQHEAFRQRVADTAMRYARDNDWCDTVRDALHEIGVSDLAVQRYAVELVIPVRVYVDAANTEDAEQYASDALAVTAQGDGSLTVEVQEQAHGAPLINPDLDTSHSTYLSSYEVVDCELAEE